MSNECGRGFMVQWKWMNENGIRTSTTVGYEWTLSLKIGQ